MTELKLNLTLSSDSEQLLTLGCGQATEVFVSGVHSATKKRISATRTIDGFLVEFRDLETAELLFVWNYDLLKDAFKAFKRRNS